MIILNKTHRIVKKIKLTVFFVLSLVLLAISCEKKDELNQQHANGLVLNYGEPAADGCGWVIQVNKIDYSPINLDAKFKKDSLKVVLNYQILASTFNCGWRDSGYQQIKIMSVSQR